MIWDGYVDLDKFVDGALPESLRICSPYAPVLDVDLENVAANAQVATEAMRCELPRLRPVELEL